MLLCKNVISESMMKWLTAVARLACIVYLNHEWNAAFPLSVKSSIIARRVARVKCKCAATRGRLYN